MSKRIRKRNSIGILLVLVFLNACIDKRPNRTEDGQDKLESLRTDPPFNRNSILYKDTIYVPIYSNIYLDEADQKGLLSATLSIRNTSYQDSLFISKIDYFNTEGHLVKSYLDHSISLRPMATVNYVIDREDDSGGSGANFIVALSAKNPHMKPLIQAVMIGHTGNRNFAFSTDGYSIKANLDTP